MTGQFGCDNLWSFSSLVDFSDNGSVTNKMFYGWCLQMLLLLYPDAVDEPGKRVMLKADSGPGCFFHDFLQCPERMAFYFSWSPKWHRAWSGDGPVAFVPGASDGNES